MEEIKEKAFLGVFWRGGYHLVNEVVSLLVKIILIRLLLPADFGLVAMATIVFTSLDIFNRFAGGQPFIRDNASDPVKAKNTLFLLNLIFLGTTAALEFFSAPAVAHFFRGKIASAPSQETLVWIIRVYALKLVFGLAASVPVAVMIKKLRFRELYLANMAGSAANLILAPILAYLGMGVWAIVLAQIMEQLVTTLLFLVSEPFVPSWKLDPQIARNYLRYNYSIFINSLALVGITVGDDTVIGRWLGPALLGFYAVGQNFAQFLVSLVNQNINEIAFPLFARAQHDRESLSRMLFKAFHLMNLFSVPLIIGCMVLAENFVLVFFGRTWLPLLPVFYILSISSLLKSLAGSADPLFRCLDKVHLVRDNQLISLGLFALLVYPAQKFYGLLGVCWVMVAVAAVPVVYFTLKVSKEIPHYVPRILKIIARIYACAMLMAGLIYAVKESVPSKPAGLAAAAIAGLFAYFGPLYLIDKKFKTDLEDGLAILRRNFP